MQKDSLSITIMRIFVHHPPHATARNEAENLQEMKMARQRNLPLTVTLMVLAIAARTPF